MRRHRKSASDSHRAIHRIVVGRFRRSSRAVHHFKHRGIAYAQVPLLSSSARSLLARNVRCRGVPSRKLDRPPGAETAIVAAAKPTAASPGGSFPTVTLFTRVGFVDPHPLPIGCG